jgi:hypothetical protein
VALTLLSQHSSEFASTAQALNRNIYGQDGFPDLEGIGTEKVSRGRTAFTDVEDLRIGTWLARNGVLGSVRWPRVWIGNRRMEFGPAIRLPHLGFCRRRLFAPA